MNIERQEIEAYQIFVVPMSNAKIIKTEFRPREPVPKYQSTEDLDDKEAPKDSVSPCDNIEKGKRVFCVTKR